MGSPETFADGSNTLVISRNWFSARSSCGVPASPASAPGPGLNALHRGAWEVALFHAETARAIAVEHDSALLAAECAGIAARAFKAMGKTDEARDRRERAEAGFRQLGATSLLERLQHDLRD